MTVDNGLYVDKQTSRHSYCVATVVALAAVQLVAASAKRVRLTFINSGADVVKINPSPNLSGAGQIVLPVAGGIITLDYETHGSLLQSAWSGFANASASIITVIDTVEQ